MAPSPYLQDFQCNILGDCCYKGAGIEKDEKLAGGGNFWKKYEKALCREGIRYRYKNADATFPHQNIREFHAVVRLHRAGSFAGHSSDSRKER